MPKVSVIAALVFLLGAPAVSFAGSLPGRWKAISMTIHQKVGSKVHKKVRKLPANTRVIMKFTADGKFLFTRFVAKKKKNKLRWKRKSKLKGTWKLRGDVLITVDHKAKKTETTIVKFLSKKRATIHNQETNSFLLIERL